MDQAQIQALMAQYLKMMGGQQNPQQLAQQQAMQQIQQPMNGMRMGGFMNPQLPQGGMGSMQGGRGF